MAELGGVGAREQDGNKRWRPIGNSQDRLFWSLFKLPMRPRGIGDDTLATAQKLASRRRVGENRSTQLEAEVQHSGAKSDRAEDVGLRKISTGV